MTARRPGGDRRCRCTTATASRSVQQPPARGAGLVLTELSVVDDVLLGPRPRRGRDLVRRRPVHLRPARPRPASRDRDLPDAALRHPGRRPAGARPGPARYADARAAATAGTSFVMYGQTEATARMAYLPPELAATRPEAIGIPIPGGSFRLDPVAECAEPGVGELVYTGPNVMLGLRRVARPTSAPGRTRRPSCAPATSPGSRRRPVRDRRPAQPAREAVRPAHRPRPRRAARCRRRRRRCGAWSPTTCCTPSPPGAAARGPAARPDRGAARPARHARCGCTVLAELPRHRQRQARPRRAGAAGPRPRPTWSAAPRSSPRAAASRRSRCATSTPLVLGRPDATVRQHASSGSAATRCPTSSSRPGWAAGSATCRPTGTPAPIADLAAGRARRRRGVAVDTDGAAPRARHRR